MSYCYKRHLVTVIDRAFLAYRNDDAALTRISGLSVQSLESRLFDQCHKCKILDITLNLHSDDDTHPLFPSILIAENAAGFNLVSKVAATKGKLEPKVKAAKGTSTRSKLFADLLCHAIKPIKLPVVISVKPENYYTKTRIDKIEASVTNGPAFVLDTIMYDWRNDLVLFSHDGHHVEIGISDPNYNLIEFFADRLKSNINSRFGRTIPGVVVNGIDLEATKS